MPINDDFTSFDSAHKVDFSSPLDDDSFAKNRAINLSGFTNDEVTRALSASLNFAFNCQIMALDGDAIDGTLFMNEDVSSCLDSRIDLVPDIVVFKADVGTTIWTECRG